MSSTETASDRARRAARRRAHNDNIGHRTMDQYELESTSAPNAPAFFSRPSNYDEQEGDSDDGDDRNLLPGQGEGSRPHGGLRRDLSSILLLLFLYLLQGIPIGISSSIPLILQNRHVTYHQQALFSFATWPFSLKLFWAPLVDSLYSTRIGRRKSWLVPTQYLIGVFMYFFSSHVGSILGDDSDHQAPNMYMLTALFFALNFLAATQDIAVDGWALTMLSRHNVGYASTCNAVGQTAGFFAGNAIFLSLESAEFCNAYLRAEPKPYGVVTLADFVWFWSLVFLSTTTLVLLFKHEVDHRQAEQLADDEELDLDISAAYRLLLTIIRLKPVLLTCGLMLTAKIAFAAGDGITGLKLIEHGVPKDKLALLAIPLTPLQIVLPWVLGRYTAGPRPMDVFQRAYPFKVLSCVLFAAIVFYTPSWQLPDNSFPVAYYVMILAAYCFHSIASYSLYVACMAFYAQVSDPTVGGTYMTLLNTITNLGGNWPVTLSLSLIDDLSWKHCALDQTNPNSTAYAGVECSADAVSASCVAAGGRCETTRDGYYTLIAVGFVVGIIWWRSTRRLITRLQSEGKSAWAVFARIPSRKTLRQM